MSTAHRLERQTFDISRSAEYFTTKELQLQTGASVGEFGDVATKELFDNAIDEAEEAGVAPEITVDVLWPADGGARLRVHDNGRGLPPETVRRILNFDTRTSSKALYRSHHRIAVRTDPAGRALVDHNAEEVGATVGTTVEVVLPTVAWDASDPETVCMGAALFNPHALVHFRPSVEPPSSILARERASAAQRRLYKPQVPLGAGWRKWLPSEPTSPHWYDRQSFERLVYGHIAAAQAGGRDLPLGEFVRQFRGLRRTQTAREVCAALPGISHLTDLEGHPELIVALLARMRALAGTPPKPDVLGLLGRDYLRPRLADPVAEGDKGHFWYEKTTWLDSGAMPWVAEVAIAAWPAERDGVRNAARQWYGLNFSPCLGDPLAGVRLVPGQDYVRDMSVGLDDLLDTLHVIGDHAPHVTMTVVHLVSPSMEHRDRGKSRLHVDPLDAGRIATMVARAARELYKEGEKNRARRYGGTVRESRPAPKRETMSFKEAFPRVIEEAYALAIGHMSTVKARSVAYQVRPRLQQLCPGRAMGHDFMDYITQRLIPDYKQAHPGALPGIDYEPRGRLIEPHTGHEVRLGTREVAHYVIPEHLYGKIFILEKKGRTPVLVEARLHERYDMAIVDTEGYATTAARELLERCSKDQHYRIFVMHDGDWHGYTIARALREETRRMPGYSVDVIDVGLFYEQAVRPRDQGGLGLPTELRDRLNELPAGLELSAAERAAFTGVPSNPPRFRNKKRIYVATCVEIDAMTNDQLVAYIVEVLEAQDAVAKVLPPDDVLVEHYTEHWEAARRERIEERILAEAQQRIEAEMAELSKGARLDDPALGEELTRMVQEALAADPYMHWRAAVEARAREGLPPL